MLIQPKAMTYPGSIGGGGGGGHAVGGNEYSFISNNNNHSGHVSHNNNNNNNYNLGGGRSVDIMTYSNYVNGSIFSLPQCWSEESTDQVLLTVYSFIKTFVG